MVLGSLKGFYSEDWSAPFKVALRGEKLAITANYESSPGHLAYRDIWVDDANITHVKLRHQDRFQVGSQRHGQLDVFLDNEQILNYDGKIGYYDQTAYLWKTGIYRATAPETLAVNVKDLKLQTGYDLPDFNSGNPNTTPTSPTPTPTPIPTPTPSTPSATITGTTGNDVLKGSSSKPMSSKAAKETMYSMDTTATTCSRVDQARMSSCLIRSSAPRILTRLPTSVWALTKFI